MRSIILLLFAAVSLQAQNGARYTASSANVSGAGEAIKINLTEWSPDSRRDEFVAAWTLTAAAPQGRGGGGRRGAAAPAAPVPALPVDPDAPDADTPPPAARGGRGGARGGGGGAAVALTPQASLLAAIKKAPTVGILWTSENVGYSIKYAYRLPQPDGSERIILATDRRVGAWSNLWQTPSTITPTDYEFSVIELHLDSKGAGEGRGVLTGKVAVDSAAKTISLEGYATLPVILKGVKRQS